jgi:glutamate/aspartate transport system permease protein
VGAYNWNWSIYWDQTPEGNGTYLDMLVSGLLTTLSVSALAFLLALLLGLVMGILRTLPGRVAPTVAACWVELFRNIPLLVQIFLWYYVLPEVLPTAWGTWLKQRPDAAFWTSVVAVGLYMSARVAVGIAAGIGAIPSGQRAAGTALGLTMPQVYRYVLVPVALRIVMPPLTSDALNTVKNTSVALVIGLTELTQRARAMQEFSFQVFEAYGAATLAYCLVNLAVTLAARALERRIAIPGHARA